MIQQGPGRTSDGPHGCRIRISRRRPVEADQRVRHIEGKISDNGHGGDIDADNLLAIDKVHYLYYLFKTDQNTVEYLKEWKTDELEDLAAFMTRVTGDDRYEDAMETGLGQFCPCWHPVTTSWFQQPC